MDRTGSRFTSWATGLLVLGVVLGWLWVRRADDGASLAQRVATGSEQRLPELNDIFDEFPETDNPDVVRMFLAWRLAERTTDPGVDPAATLDAQLARFGKFYRRLARLTR